MQVKKKIVTLVTIFYKSVLFKHEEYLSQATPVAIIRDLPPSYMALIP